MFNFTALCNIKCFRTNNNILIGNLLQVINASGKLMMVQREEYDVDEDNNPVSTFR